MLSWFSFNYQNNVSHEKVEIAGEVYLYLKLTIKVVIIVIWRSSYSVDVDEQPTHFIRVPPSKSMASADGYYPDRGYLVDYFAIKDWKISGMGGD